MPVVPHPVPLARLQGKVPAEPSPEVLGQLPHAASGAAAHIEDLERRALVPGGEKNCPHHIVHEDPVALLLAVLVERGRLAPAEARGEGRDDGAVGVREGLAGAVHNAVAQDRRGNVETSAHEEGEPLRRELGDAVGRDGSGRGAFVRGHGGQAAPAGGAGRLPFPSLELGERAQLGMLEAVALAAVRPFAIDAEGRSDHDLSHTGGHALERVVQLYRPPGIDVEIAAGVGIGPDRRRHVKDEVDLGKRPRPRPGVAHVPANDLDPARCHLGVEDAHPASPGQERGGETRADEARATGHEGEATGDIHDVSRADGASPIPARAAHGRGGRAGREGSRARADRATRWEATAWPRRGGP